MCIYVYMYSQLDFTTTERREDTSLPVTVVLVSIDVIPVVVVMPVVNIIIEL